MTSDINFFKKWLIKLISGLSIGLLLGWIFLGLNWSQSENSPELWSYHLQGLLGIFFFWGIGWAASGWLAQKFSDHVDSLNSKIIHNLEILPEAPPLLMDESHYPELRQFRSCLKRLTERLAPLQQRNAEFEKQVEAHVHSKTQEYYEVCEELIGIDSMKGRFMLKFSQTLRTPISVIRTYTEKLNLDDLPPESTIREMAAIIHNESLVLTDLVNEIFEMLTLKEQGLELDREMIDLNSLLNSTEKEIHSKFDEKGIRYSTKIQTQNLMVIADRQRLGNSIKRLLEVSLSRTDDGQVQLSVEDDQAWTVLRIVDDAPPIKPEGLQLNLGELADQADDYYENHWSGLKLALCNEIIALQGGEFSLRINEDQKNEMCIKLIPYQSESLQLEPELY